MPTVDSFVQVAADGAGKKIDNSVVTQSDGVTTAYRQRTNVADPSDPAGFAPVRAGDSLHSDPSLAVSAANLDQLLELTRQLLDEFRTLSIFIQNKFN